MTRRLRRDLASLDAHALACLAFARPVYQRNDDRALLEGVDECDQEHDEAVFVRIVTELFRVDDRDQVSTFFQVHTKAPRIDDPEVDQEIEPTPTISMT